MKKAVFTKKQIEEFLLNNPGYLKKSPSVVQDALAKKGGAVWPHEIREVQRHLKSLKGNTASIMKVLKPRVTGPKKKEILSPRGSNEVINVGIIGDLHEPFTRPGYREFCIETFIKYGVNKIVFIGDIIDNHFSSYHETIPDGKSAGDELDDAINKLAPWREAFPNAKVCIGNHDAIIHRKAITAGISKRWIKEYNEVLGCPNWDFDMQHEISGVLYTHGTGSSGNQAAITRALNMRQSVVQGHIHTVAGVQYNASNKDLLFGLQVGCGVDDKSYAMAYASTNIKKSILGCGLVLNNGTLPLFIPMFL